MKKNILTGLLVVAVLLFLLAWWKFWSDNYGSDVPLIDSVVPVEEENNEVEEENNEVEEEENNEVGEEENNEVEEEENNEVEDTKPTVADEDFDPKTFEDEEINELINLLEDLLAE